VWMGDTCHLTKSEDRIWPFHFTSGVS
jgi:hypothetical protein